MDNKTFLTAKDLLEFLLELEEQGNDLATINVYHRHDRDSDEYNVVCVEEDLYDEETNSVLTSIMLLNDDTDY